MGLTMFDLDQNVRSWRDAASHTLRATPDVLDELESHLRDEFDRLTRAGSSPQEAWAKAVEGLGTPQQLAGEFTKLRVRTWIPAWIANAVLILFVAVVAWVFVKGPSRPLLTAHVIAVCTGYGAVFAVGFLALCAALTRALSGWNESQNAAFRAAGGRLSLLALFATSIGVVLGMVWAHYNMGRWWGWDPKEIGGACVVAWSAALMFCFVSRHATAQSLMTIAGMGNMVVAIGWFGPALLGHAKNYGYTSPIFGMILGGFLLAQVLVICLIQLPPLVLRPARQR